MAKLKKTVRSKRGANTKGGSLVTPRPALADRSPNWPVTLNDRIIACREALSRREGLDILPAHAAKRLKMTQVSYDALENGKTHFPKSETLMRMRDTMSYDIDYVMFGKGVPLLPSGEDAKKERELVQTFRELEPKSRDNLISIAHGLRSAQRSGGAN